jgi:hypothetical protein
VDPMLAFVLYLAALILFGLAGGWATSQRSFPLALGMFGLAAMDLVLVVAAGKAAL